MQRYLWLLLLGLMCPGAVMAQHTISGTITDKVTGETLIGATIYDTRSGKGTTTNINGRYTLTVKGQEAVLRITFVGYTSIFDTISLKSNTVRNYAIKPSVTLDAVVVRSQRINSVESSQMSAIEIPVEQLKSVPVMFGEADVVKAVQLLPGVQSASEGTGGMYVRGGGPDENLYLLDGIPIYNVNHLGGFFSAFNADAVKNVTLYKGSFPARFGGRLSSVLDVTTNNGNDKELHGNLSVGFISAKVSLEGPIVKEKTTFCLSARRTYADFLLQPLVKRLATDGSGKTKLTAGYYFYDINAKVTHRFDDRNNLYTTFYTGDDDAYGRVRTMSSLGEDTYMRYANNWGNLVGGLRWNHVIGAKMFMNVSLSYTQYQNKITAGTEKIATLKDGSEQLSSMTGDYVSRIRDLIARVDFAYTPVPEHNLQFGGNYTRHWFQPSVASASVDYFDQIQMNSAFKMDTTLQEATTPAHEMVLFAEDDWSINDILKINYGLHLSGFAVEESFYPSLQPRLSARVMVNDRLSFKAGYAYMSQYLHMLSTVGVSLPTDLWVPSTNRIRPMTAHQVAASANYTLPEIADLSIEGYYKYMNNLIAYRDGVTAFGTSQGWEDLVCMGRGWTYGVEFLAQRTIGKFTGWIGYTWSKTTHLFDREGQVLNNGNAFPAKYDRRHDISIVVCYKFSEQFDISATWVFSTGNTATLAMQQYAVASENPDDYTSHTNMSNTIQYVESRNNYRLPNYHRADISANFHRKFKGGRWHRTLNVSIYNLYNHANPYLIYTSTELTYKNYSKALVQLSIFPILPSVAYTLFF